MKHVTEMKLKGCCADIIIKQDFYFFLNFFSFFCRVLPKCSLTEREILESELNDSKLDDFKSLLINSTEDNQIIYCAKTQLHTSSSALN